MSLFDLKQNADELPSLNQGIAKLTYQQVQTTRNATGDAFPKGNINLKWETSGVRWWIPSRSYIRMRCRYYSAGGVLQPTNNSDIAPNMGVCSALFSSAEFRMGDKTVSRVSNYMAQVDALQKRLKKSRSWMNGIGDSLEKWNPSFQERQNQITSDGFVSDSKTQYVEPAGIAADVFGFDIVGVPGNPNQVAVVAATGIMTFTENTGAAINILNNQVIHVGDKITIGAIIYQVTRVINATSVNVVTTNGVLADLVAQNIVAGNLFHPVQNQTNNDSDNRSGIELIWQPPLSIWAIDHALPSGKYELVLTPQNTNEYKRRAIESLTANKALADFDFVIDDMYLYLATVEGPAVDSLSYFMSLEETRCQSVDVNNDAGLQQQNFDVSPATYAITCAFQSADLLDTRNSASKFKFAAPNNTVPSGELNFNRFFIQYNGEQKPSPDADPDYASPKAFIASRYAESLLYSNAYFDQGGGESLQEWIDRGLYMYYAFPKDGSSESTRVNVNFSFQAAPGANLANLLVFDHHKKMVLVSIQNGRIVDLIEQDG